MPRTTIDIEAPILRELKAIRHREGRSLGRIVSQLLAEALARHKVGGQPAEFRWTSVPMGARVDLSDKEALHAALDRDEG